MSNSAEISKVLRLIENAESSLKAARNMLAELSPEAAEAAGVSTEDLGGAAYSEGEKQVVEGHFDGQKMRGPKEKTYPVPPNYASKSKLVEGDRLKLTIMPNGSFLYKQIAPVEREFLKGTLIYEDGQYKVTTDKGTFRVLLASVTYYKGQMGDEVTLIIPKDRNAQWGAIEAILPQFETEAQPEHSF